MVCRGVQQVLTVCRTPCWGMGTLMGGRTPLMSILVTMPHLLLKALQVRQHGLQRRQPPFVVCCACTCSIYISHNAYVERVTSYSFRMIQDKYTCTHKAVIALALQRRRGEDGETTRGQVTYTVWGRGTQAQAITQVHLLLSSQRVHNV